MIYGFTGTRAGMTERQKQALELILCDYSMAAFHHGGCHGADAEATLEVGRLRLRFALETDERAGLICLGLARIIAVGFAVLAASDGKQEGTGERGEPREVGPPGQENHRHAATYPMPGPAATA